MTRIKSWRAARSGASITIKGVDVETGEAITLAQVAYIEAGDLPATAVTKDGLRFSLVPHNALDGGR